jgi:hypothetical protein
MKITLLLVGIVLISGLAAKSALADGGTGSSTWTCEAMGQQQEGGPVGPIILTTQGSGATEFDANDAAIQSCMEEGLQMCSVTDCFQN